MQLPNLNSRKVMVMHQEQQQNLLTVSEVSNYLQIKQKTIYAKAEAGEIPCYRIGRLIRFSKNEIDEWLESCRSGNNPKTDQQKIRRNKRKSSKLINNHVDKITRNIIDAETSKYYHTDNGKSDRIEAQEKENNHGSI